MPELRFGVPRPETPQSLVNFFVNLISQDIQEPSQYKEGILIYDSSLESFHTADRQEKKNYAIRFYPTQIKILHETKEATITGDTVSFAETHPLAKNQQTYKIGYEKMEDGKILIRFFKILNSQFFKNGTPLVA